jgi:hypothetical protein
LEKIGICINVILMVDFNDDCEREITQIEARWGSEEKLLQYCDIQVREFHRLICNPNTIIPEIEVRPSFLRRGIFGEKNAGGEYIPEGHGSPAIIALYFPIILDEHLIQLIIAHELIHHWEDIGGFVEDFETVNLDKADEIITNRFFNNAREAHWRSAHSTNYIAKSVIVSEQLGIDMKSLLFG